MIIFQQKAFSGGGGESGGEGGTGKGICQHRFFRQVQLMLPLPGGVQKYIAFACVYHQILPAVQLHTGRPLLSFSAWCPKHTGKEKSR